MAFSSFVQQVRRRKNLDPLPDFSLLSLDPGQTTGWALWACTSNQVMLAATGQAITWPIEFAVIELQALIDRGLKRPPLVIVHEAYNIYAHKLSQHTHSNVPTLRVIGVIETIATQAKVPFITQTAQVAKAFSTDGNLKTWGFYEKGKRHARDAIRHGAYFILFADVAELLKPGGPKNSC